MVSSLKELVHPRTSSPVVLDGQSLDVSAVVAVARHDCTATITANPTVHQSIQASVNQLNTRLANGATVYGVNTGFGGSADTRTADHRALQKALIQHHNAAVVLPHDDGLNGYSHNHRMPVPIVRAAMLTRCNSLLRGHSAVRLEVVEAILTFLRNSMTPVVPLRGSISASGDLTPLAYIAGALEGNPDIAVYCGKDARVIPADEALRELGLQPLDFGPKEGLGLLNGTAFSGGAASLVVFDATRLLSLSQMMTAMATEALGGMASNYHPFISLARPHQGQAEAAANIFRFLADSRLATVSTGPEHTGLAQDRYALRTSPQWIGPQIESMALALRQVRAELNSTTDNPLVDPENGTVHHGGNFQAASITSAMEKTTSAVQMIGRMIFAQCSELINPVLSNGLPPNLSVDDPSLSFAFKGVDINMASYVSELGYLNHPVSNHVQSAEMHNQGLNSLALIGCRYAAEAVDVLSLMTATYLYVLCQALDLRALHAEFVRDVRGKIDSVTSELCHLDSSQRLRDELLDHWRRHSTSDLEDRAVQTANSSVGVFLDLMTADSSGIAGDEVAREWKTRVARTLADSYTATRTGFLENPTTKNYLCSASRSLYGIVRGELDVPLHRGLEDHPAYDRAHMEGKKCIGSRITTIYTAVRDGRFDDVLATFF
ncbi:phenylalanine ammonia-lyase [Aspergillus candidus]|uniref:Phenylalanine ammonia-lyase n=1 Tax=Aspergillus candidus TaxID=41067 RepID=A0A2I2FL30_ASPCN|nr:phenylalanine ammonia-lyase [Aspergillus candidus]PLB41347.1 phenylalanine ammonia-lyase [Aspergillus candidus]